MLYEMCYTDKGYYYYWSLYHRNQHSVTFGYSDYSSWCQLKVTRCHSNQWPLNLTTQETANQKAMSDSEALKAFSLFISDYMQVWFED